MLDYFNRVIKIGCRHGTRAGVTEVFEGHAGPLTGISCHSAAGGIDFSHLFLTSSMDWTLKLWSLKVCFNSNTIITIVNMITLMIKILGKQTCIFI